MLRFALLLVLLAPQDDPLARARALVQKLRSESLEDRDDARKALSAMGRAALTVLREALRDPDAEVVRIASTLIARVDFLEKLTPRFRRHFADAEERLAAGGDAACLEFLRDAIRSNRTPPLPLTRADLDPIVGPALRAPMSDEEFRSLCDLIRQQKFKSAAPELRAILKTRPERSAAAAYTLYCVAPVSAEDIEFVLKAEESGHWTAVQMLKGLGDDSARKTLRAISGVTGSSGRAEAAVQLCEWGESGPLFDLLGSDDTDSLADAIRLAGESHLRESIPGLVKILETPARQPEWETALRALEMMRAPEGFPAASRMISDPDASLRSAAADLLVAAGGPKDIPLLDKLFRDPHAPVVVAGVRAAAAWNAREFIPRLRELIRDSRHDFRAEAAQALGTLKAREAIPDLIALLHDKNLGPEVGAVVNALVALDAREAVPVIAGISNTYEALRELDARDQIPAIVARLMDPSPRIRSNILSILSEFRWSQTAADVAKLLTDPEPQVQLRAIWTLYQMNATGQVALVEKLLTAGGDAADAAFATVAKLDPPRAEAHMRRALGDANARIRNRAVFWLARRGDPQGLEALENLASDPGESVNSVREAVLDLPPEPRARLASKLLTHLRDKPAYVDRLAPLADAETRERWAALLDARDPDLRTQAISLLLESGDPKFVPRIRALIEDSDPKVRGAALSSLAARGDREIVPAIRERLFDINSLVRLSAVAAVESLKLTEAIPDLEELLIGELGDWMPTRVAGVLGRLKSRSSVAPLRALLKKPDPYNVGLRITVLYSLRQIGDPAAIPDIARLLNDPKPEIRSSAAHALLQLGGPDQRDRIESLRRDPNSGVRVEAAELLADVPALESFLKDPSIGVRDSAALRLAKLGSPAGVLRILRRTDYVEGYPLYMLSGVRRPEEYARLSRTRFTQPLRGSVREMILSQLTPLGFRLDETAVQGEEWEKHASAPAALDPYPDYDDAMHVLETHLSHPFDFVIEKDAVRVIPIAEARRFWKAWWAERPKK